MAATQIKSKQQFAVNSDISFATFGITNLKDPVNAQDAATKAYVDAASQSLTIKDSVRLSTTGAETYTIVANVVTSITGTVIDGISVALNDRILIKNAPAVSGSGGGAGATNSTQPANGLYYVSALAANMTLTRTTDADASDEVKPGMFVFTTEGTANANNGYVLRTTGTIVLNTTPLQFTQFSGAGQINAGDGLTKTGNTINVVSASAARIAVAADSIDLATVTVSSTASNQIKRYDYDSYGRISGQANANLTDISTSIGTINQNLVYAGPATGAAANPTFRALVAADIPDISAAKITSGILGVTYGGTGVNGSTAANGQLLIGNGSGFTQSIPNGTADRISITTGSGSLTFDIASTYVGQTSIVTLGVVSTGTWSATAIGATKGGTGLTSYVLGDTLYASAANTISTLAGNTTTTRRFLRQVGNGTISAAPAWDTVTAADITGVALTKTDDTNVTLTLGGNASTALVATASLTLGWSGQLAISRGGTNASTATAGFNNLSPANTLGDLIYSNGTNNVRLAGNTTTTKQFLTQTGSGSVSAAPAWGGITTSDIGSAQALAKVDDTNVTLTLSGSPTTALLAATTLTLGWTGSLAVTRGGTGITSYAVGDLLYATAATTLSKLAGVATGNVLISGGVATAPSWGKVQLSGGSSHVSGTLAVTNGGTGSSTAPSNGQVLIGNGTGFTLATITGSSTVTVTNGGGSISIDVATGTTGTMIYPNYIVRETPTGLVNGTNNVFTLANVPLAGSENVYVNGILQTEGSSADYTINTATKVITFVSGSIPNTGDIVRVSYLK